MTLSRERYRSTVYTVIITVRKVYKKLAKTEPKQKVSSVVCRKEAKDETVRMAGGRLFHARDVATGKARSPRVNRCTSYKTNRSTCLFAVYLANSMR